MSIISAYGEGRQAPPFQSLASGCIVGAMTPAEIVTEFIRAIGRKDVAAAAETVDWQILEQWEVGRTVINERIDMGSYTRQMAKLTGL
jgi:hypothetical protein